MRLTTIATAALLGTISATTVNAATFNFFFSADPSANPSIISSNDPTLSATGVLDINVANGELFTAADVDNIDIVVMGSSFTDSSVITKASFNGQLSAGGSSAFVTNLSLLGGGVLSGLNLFYTFENFIVFDNPELERLGTPIVVQFTDPSAARTSLQLTAQVSAVPLPAGSLLLLSGLAGVAALKRRKKSGI